MLSLTERDQALLRDLAGEVTDDERQRQEVFTKMKAAYEKYGDEEFIGEKPREQYFKETYQRLLSNLYAAGQNSAEIFTKNRDHIKNTLRRLGISFGEIDELADKAIHKLWRFQYAEKYNPLRATWNHYLYVPLKRIAASYWEARYRDPVAMGFAFQQDRENSHGEEFSLEPYEQDQWFDAEKRAMVKEYLLDFEIFLSTKGSHRSKTLRYKEVCTLLPPGMPSYKIQERIQAYVVNKGKKNHRVELLTGHILLWEVVLLQDVRANAEEECEAQKIVRTPLTLYKYLMERGAQVAELTKELRIGDSTAHSWVNKLAELFKEWWLTSDKIPDDVRYLAYPLRTCPGCKWDHTEILPVDRFPAEQVNHKGEIIWKRSDKADAEIREGAWCDICKGWELSGLKPKVDLPFPWGKVRGSHSLADRARKYSQKLTIQRCGL